MDTRRLEKFAQSARRQLHEQVAARLDRVLTTDSAELRAKEKTIKELKEQIAASSRIGEPRRAVVEKVAYTWFNRFCALRYMDVNHYTRVGAVSPATSPTGEAFTQPEILQEAKQGVIDERFRRTVDAQTVSGLLNGRLPSSDPQQEAYRLLLVGVCNAYHACMPFMFEKIDDYTELLMPDDLLSGSSILQAVREALTKENCADVEVIGWLYQFYISEKKDAVMARKCAVPSADIPAVTQLFTPHWIVRYMVENSLGRLWMLNHPDSRLVERMDYYVAPEQEITDFLRVTSPEEIRLCDPAAGSGHILTYAFDLLTAIYEEQGYNPVDIPRLIMEKNLTGLEIDPRAGALAGFALMMKAREKDARFFARNGGDSGRAVQPDICVLEDVTFTPQELDAYMDAVGRDLFTQDVGDWLGQFEQATTFGSLIRPLVTDTAFIRERLDEVGVFQNLFLSHTHDKLRAVLRMTEALRPRYHVVVANPPYMGSGNMNAVLKQFAKDKYPKSKSDLCTMFIERNLDLLARSGYVGMVTMHGWMFTSSFENLREHIITQETIETMAHLGPRAFDTISGEIVSTTTFTLRHQADPAYKGQYFRLIAGNSEAEKAQMLLDDLQTDNWELTNYYYRASTADFKKIPGAPIAYWVSKAFLEAFNFPSLGNQVRLKAGLSTGDNTQFQRYWFNVSYDSISFHANSIKDTLSSEYKWYPCHSGGSYRKWYGNHETLVLWKNNGERIRSFGKESGRIRSAVRNQQYYFIQGITWTKISSGKLGVRWRPAGFLFDDTGRCGFSSSDTIQYSLALLCSKVAHLFLTVLCPTLSFTSGEIAKIPFKMPSENVLDSIIPQCIRIEQRDWDFFETSWDFQVSPLIIASHDLSSVDKEVYTDGLWLTENAYQLPIEKRCLEMTFTILRTRWQLMTDKIQRLEEGNNHLFIEAYGLENELSPKVPLSEVTLTCNPHYRYGSSRLKTRNWAAFREQFPETCQRLADISAEMAPDMPEEERLGLEQRLLDDTMREFISYAVGCMFGRYSLDKPGLILANQGETLDDYLRQVPDPTFMPDEDNVIPMLDGDWFPDDVSERFKAFLKVTFGEEHYEENMAFIEAAIGRDICSYFLRDFYDDHVKTYNKRPIYWRFSSPDGSFNALIYVHRYRPDTVSVVLNDYLREFRTKLTARKRHLEHVERSAATTPRDKTQAVNEIVKIDKILNELKEYEDKVLYPLATQQVEIDLDDGVLVNYKKFGQALAHVRGLSGKAFAGTVRKA